MTEPLIKTIKLGVTVSEVFLHDRTSNKTIKLGLPGKDGHK